MRKISKLQEYRKQYKPKLPKALLGGISSVAVSMGEERQQCFEENEADLVATAGQLALRNVPVLIFQEGHNPVAQRAFAALARTTRGALLPFSPGSIGQLGELLGAAVQFAVGALEALERHAQRSGGNAAQELLRQIPER